MCGIATRSGQRKFSGAFGSPAAENPLGLVAPAGDSSAERGGEKAPWRDPDTTISRVPRAKLMEELPRKGAGVSTIWVGVLVPGTWYPHY